jgi:hypothetical protein
MREAEQHQRAAESKERELAAKREVSADQYSRMVDVQIANRQEDTGEPAGVQSRCGYTGVGCQAVRLSVLPDFCPSVLVHNFHSMLSRAFEVVVAWAAVCMGSG